MSTKLLYIIIAVLLDGVAGLAGGLLPLAFVHRHIVSLLAFASGTLLGVAFLDLMPEALGSPVPPHEVMFAGMVGFLGFHFLQTLLGGHAAGQSGHKHTKVGPMLLIGDAAHNLTDGAAIAAAFITDTKAGIATTLAVIVHELPQEIGDFAILVSHGYSRKRALFLLMLVQLSALVGAIGTLIAAGITTYTSPFLMAFSAGGFVYIAAADLLPHVQREKAGATPLTKLLAFVAGVGAVALLEFIHI